MEKKVPNRLLTFAWRQKRPETTDGMEEIPRVPVKYDEYEAIKWIRGMLGYGEVYLPRLEERLKIFTNDWRMMRSALAMIRQVMDRMMWTMDKRHAERLSVELVNSEWSMRVKDAGAHRPDGHSYVDVYALQTALEMIQDDYCTVCAREGRQEIKKCKMRKCLDAMMTWDIEGYNDNKDICPFEGIKFSEISALVKEDRDRWIDK